MSALTRRSPDRTPRLVTKADADPEQVRAVSERYAHDPSRPNPTAQADAMGSTVLAYLITGPLLFGAIGWGIDRWLGVTGFIAAGIIAGMGLSLYTIWLRYGTSQAPTHDDPEQGSTTAAQPHNEEIQ
ncbi:AtpZ/AtpI family protein [Janibacter anophelis]|uniref:AtpZ/AtpI family protein n=1 Tax=Janibacter anophelis TaxID=319054 RepID=UPI0008318499|nr:AtpZ/AtpI family protein [Janibacter anophelis]